MASPYAVLIYPGFSLQEITCITSCLSVWFNQSIDILASEKKPYTSEEGFQVLPTGTLEDACPSDYQCVILPGTINPLPALHDEALIDFLRRGKDAPTLFAAISSAPSLLAKSGILDGKDFTAGFFMQFVEAFPFIDGTHFKHRPVMKSGNVITGIGMFFREFAELVLRSLGYPVGEDFMNQSQRQYSEKELTFYWSEEDHAQFLQELKKYQP